MADRGIRLEKPSVLYDQGPSDALLCDVGNTTTVVGLWDADHIERRGGSRQTGREPPTRDGCCFARCWPSTEARSRRCPVVGGATQDRSVARGDGRLIDGPLIVFGPGVKTGIALAVDNPREVGADRVANAIGAQVSSVHR